MTTEQMETAAWLNRAYYLKMQIKSLKDQKEELKSLAEITSGTGQGSAGHTSPGATNGTENAYLRFMKIDAKISDTIEALSEQYEEITNAIGEVRDPLLQSILREHYLNFKTMPQIAKKHYYSLRMIKYKHKEALDMIAPFSTCTAP